MAGSSSSKNAVLIAIFGNGLVTVLKFITFAISGSGAMLSESLHSAADTGNQLLLFIGIRRSEGPADATFHYGRGAERFLFSLFSAIGIFLLGCGVTLYHGVHATLHPPELSYHWSIFAVLGIALLVDGFVLWKAAQIVLQNKGDKSFIEYVRESSDPTLAAVLLEDGVACLGVVIAFVAILLSMATGSHIPDVVATFLIGAMMGLIAFWLGYKNSALIIGRAIPKDMQDDVVRFLEEQESVVAVSGIRTRIVGSDLYRLSAQVDWSGARIAESMVDWVEERADRLTSSEGRREFTIAFGEHMTNTVALEVDRIETELKKRHPELDFLDLESE
ncbi:MAG: cation diffusion facilitator family transporter [bacterium]|nr:cation diffusion facilitator family transporter [bacterium]